MVKHRTLMPGPAGNARVVTDLFDMNSIPVKRALKVGLDENAGVNTVNDYSEI